MKEKDIKLLWGRAANRCSICRAELSQDAKSTSASYALGEQAHIVGEKDDAARGKSILSAEERDGYHNRILLCPTHHTEIDKNEADWPVEKLHYTKSRHELWVSETLAESSDLRRAARQVAVASIIDSAVDLCRLEKWKQWTSWALSADPQWSVNLPEKAFEFRQRVAAAIWPDDCDELRRATTTLSILMHRAAEKLMEHAILRNETFCADRFYRAGGRFNPNYDSDAEKFNTWVAECHGLVIECTRAANWFADVVRRDVNPMFFAEAGRFVVVLEMDENLKCQAAIPVFTDLQKSSLPSGL